MQRRDEQGIIWDHARMKRNRAMRAESCDVQSVWKCCVVRQKGSLAREGGPMARRSEGQRRGRAGDSWAETRWLFAPKRKGRIRRRIAQQQSQGPAGHSPATSPLEPLQTLVRPRHNLGTHPTALHQAPDQAPRWVLVPAMLVLRSGSISGSLSSCLASSSTLALTFCSFW